MKKWIGISALLAAAGVLLLVGLSQRLVVRDYRIESPKIQEAVTLAVVSDLHNVRYGEGQKTLMDALLAEEPDALLMVGDMVNGPDEMENALALVRNASALMPVYYVSGNHEYGDGDEGLEQIKAAFVEAGARVLEGEGEMLKGVRICGVDDPISLNRQQWLDQLDACRAKDDTFTVLMTHRPERVSRYEEGFDLVLAGHAHGGQLRLPGLINGLWAPNQGWFPRYAGGEYEIGAGRMIVSRGLVRGAWPPRLFNPPELVVVKLLPAQDSMS